jgi:hypothetical protein
LEEREVKRLLRSAVALIKWAIILVLGIELLSFVIVSASNFVVYGQLREGSRAVYDPYTLFLQTPAIRPTANNALSADAGKNRTIWMFGGSTMRGATDDDAATIPSFVAQQLNLSADGLRFTVVNFGIDSFNSLLETKYLEKALIENVPRPDIVVFYDGANDAKYFVEHRTADGHHGYRRVQALIESYYRSWFGLLKPINAAVYASFTRELYDRLNQVAFPLDPAAPELQRMIDRAEQRYDFVDRLVAALGARFVLVWQPMLWTEGCAVDPKVAQGEKTALIDSDRLEVMRRNFTIVYRALAERMSGKPYYTSFAGALCGRTQPLYRPDGVHLQDEGRRTVAIAMSRMLSERFFERGK